MVLVVRLTEVDTAVEEGLLVGGGDVVLVVLLVSSVTKTVVTRSYSTQA
jgi:hypothetical protein